MPDERLIKFFPLVKVDESTRMVYGLVTAEVPDKDGETCEYASTKPEYQKVNEELGKASGGENIMPLREMHQLNAVGAGKSIEFDDSRKQIRMAFKVVDDSAWKKVCEKVLIGFSQGGRYIKKWKQDGKDFYTAQPGEVSLVDNPCLPGAYIEYAKADGSTELFKTPDRKLSKADIKEITDALRDSLEKGVKYLAAGGHLPYTDESGKPDHAHMGAAWAALHGGYRGNKYAGPGKEHAIARLKELYHSEGIPTPSEKAAALADELGKSEEEIWKLLTESVRQTDSTTGVDMNPEQIKKCAVALGISEEEFKKKFVEGDALEKGKGGLAALHSHLKKAHALHGKMHEMHKTMGEHHKQMADHLENCMKAHGACMDGAEAEKVLKALIAGENVESRVEPKTEDLEAIVAKAVAAATKELSEKLDKIPAASGARLFSVDRDTSKVSKISEHSPFPI